MTRTAQVLAILAAGLMLGPGSGPAEAGEPGCPESATILARLGELDLGKSSRTARFDEDPPTGLFSQAAEKPGRPVIETEGIVGFATMLVELPVEAVWMALNDEEHFIQGGYLPLQQSEVIDGTARSGERLIYQSFKSFGIGRWWVNRVWQNADLYASSGGILWELAWEDVMLEMIPDAPPLDGLIGGLTPIDNSRGAWLLVSLGESCTLMEYFTDSNPGGMVSTAQRLFGGRTLRATLEGMVMMAREEIPQPHEGPAFERPDGSVIER